MSTKKIPMLSRVCQHLLPTSLMLPMMMMMLLVVRMTDHWKMSMDGVILNTSHTHTGVGWDNTPVNTNTTTDDPDTQSFYE